jgi:hypothetical protein
MLPGQIQNLAGIRVPQKGKIQLQRKTRNPNKNLKRAKCS